MSVGSDATQGGTTTTGQSSLMGDDSQFARKIIERKLASVDEVELVRDQVRELQKKGQPVTLAEMLVKFGYITKSQLDRLNLAMDEDSMYRPAQQIPGYQILGKLGQGAMATVFKAKQLSLDRIVAIKVLPRRLSENQEFVDRFYREGRAAARLNDPNIVAAYDVGEAMGYHYFVMEYIDGTTAYDLLSNGQKKWLDEKDAISIVSQVARALQHAHDKGLIHRDVKPKNIMITRNKVVKLADMGLAREVDDHKAATAEAGRAYGTPYYISPEQIRGEIKIDHRADIYSLGATFYHLVTGKVPFEGPTPSAVMHKHLKESLIPPDHINTALSTGIGEIIEVMMAKNADLRYQSADEVIEDLEAVRNGEPPFQARRHYNADLLEDLASGGEVIASPRHPLHAPMPANHVSVNWVVAMGVLLFVSVMVNLLLLLR
ncbi:MAG: serine/threonine protein kinase [Phycisphaerales bacterium]|nr:MAG: serine/threonine protein kinase [Phycisphaerales bacterium]